MKKKDNLSDNLSDNIEYDKYLSKGKDNNVILPDSLSSKTRRLLSEASRCYAQNFRPVAWYGRCIFLSWYCDLATCKFCFRSTTKHKIKHARSAKRSLASVLVEALLCKKLGWRIEFLTGGYKIFPIDELVEIARLVSYVYGEKIWLNLGVIEPDDLKRFEPYIKGIVSSIETIEPSLHDKVCPNKPIAPYEKMFSYAQGLKKSMTIVIGLGEKEQDFALLADFIRKHDLERITFYALKPVKGTEFEGGTGPDTASYLWWIAQTRIAFPHIEIIAGTTPRRYQEVGALMSAGANAFTKFPATKMFGTSQAHRIVSDIALAKRSLMGTITNLPKDTDWDKEIEDLDISKELKSQIRQKLSFYLSRMRRNIDDYQKQ